MTTRHTLLIRSAVAVVALLGLTAVAVSPATSSLLTRTAAAQDHGSGGHEGGGGTEGGGGHEGGGGKGHKGPDPNCAFQDRTGRGGFGPQARRGQSGGGGGHSDGGHTDGGGDSHATEGDHRGGGVYSGTTVATDPGGGIVGGGAGGESYVCDGPGDWSVDGKVLDR